MEGENNGSTGTESKADLSGTNQADSLDDSLPWRQ
jgi:hypothetical protein